MLKRIITALSLVAVLSVAGCGGSMVGEDAPTYPVAPLLKEATQAVILRGTVQGKNGVDYDVVLTIRDIDRSSAGNNASFTIDFDGQLVKQGVAGTFREMNNRSVIVFTEPFQVSYMSDEAGNPIYHDFVFYSSVTPSTLVYSGDPSEGPVDLNPVAQSICRLQWPDDNDANKTTPRPIQFETIETE